jgi:hypothetical protein
LFGVRGREAVWGRGLVTVACAPGLADAIGEEDRGIAVVEAGGALTGEGAVPGTDDGLGFGVSPGDPLLVAAVAVLPVLARV